MPNEQVFCVALKDLENNRRYPPVKVLVDRDTRDVGSIVVLHNMIPPTDLSQGTVALHRHEDVDEVIYCIEGEGIALVGPSKADVKEIPFKGPCLIFAPANYYHRVVNRTGKNIETLVLYSPKGAQLRSFEEIIGSAEVIEMQASERVRM